MPIDIHNWLLVFVRTGAFLSLVPLFSVSSVPMQVRLAMTAMVSFLLSASLPAFPQQDWSFLGLTALMLREVGVGLTLGFITRMVFFVSDFAGALITSEMGLNLSVSFNPLAGLQSQAPGMILFYLAAMLMLGLNLHHWFLVAFQRSYEVLPIGTSRMTPGVLEAVVKQTSGIFSTGLLIAAPLIAVSFIITVVFVVLSRAVPQMNVFVESFAFRIMAGLAVFALTIHLMAQHISNYTSHLPEDILRVAQLLRGG